MYKSFVLKHVAEPPRLLFASFQATIISMGVWMLLAIVAKGLGFSFIMSFVASIIGFITFHGCMIFSSYRDPYFLNVFLAGLRCGKTKNIAYTKNNRYGD